MKKEINPESGAAGYVDELSWQITGSLLKHIDNLLVERIKKHVPYFTAQNAFMLKDRLSLVKQLGQPDRYYLDYETDKEVLLLEVNQGTVTYNGDSITYQASYK